MSTSDIFNVIRNLIQQSIKFLKCNTTTHKTFNIQLYTHSTHKDMCIWIKVLHSAHSVWKKIKTYLADIHHHCGLVRCWLWILKECWMWMTHWEPILVPNRTISITGAAHRRAEKKTSNITNLHSCQTLGVIFMYFSTNLIH